MTTAVVSIFAAGDYERHLRQSVELLRTGGIVVMPTETVYGAAGLITHAGARQRLRELRNGSSGQPFTIHVASAQHARLYLGEISPLGERLMKKLWPGPVGLLFDVPADRRTQVATELGVAESDIYDANGGITLRCPDHFVAADVLVEVQGPVALTGVGAPGGQGTGDQLARELAGKVDLILDAGPTKYANPSTLLKIVSDPAGEERYQIVRQGVYDERIIDRLLRTTILFVCSGNTCRSPMAEAIARHLLAEEQGVPEPELERKGVSIVSAGAFALPGSRATPQAVDAVKAHGADLSAHRSRQLTPELIHQADVIYTMGRNHAATVAAMVPSAREKVETLDPTGDIEDPIGGSIDLYQDLAGHLRTLIVQRLDELKD